MIFVTVGTDTPFDRMVRVIDEWAGSRHRSDVFAQIGNTEFKPQHLSYQKFIEPKEFAGKMAAASLIVSHAGMGTIISALRAEKPILVMPRLAALRETRNEHQVATARRLLEMGKIHVAFDEQELARMLDRLDELKPRAKMASSASPELLQALRDFISRS